jgi:Ca2+-binding EF-hand superfamily protein
MTLRHLPVFAAAGLFASCATTKPTAAPFDIADANGNGKVSKEEFDAYMAKWTFNRYDTNRDGKVSFEEWKAADPTADMATFKKIDTNGDGFVSPEEGLAAVHKKGVFNELFATIDTNKDGMIDRAESAAYGDMFSANSTNNFPGLKAR